MDLGQRRGYEELRMVWGEDKTSRFLLSCTVVRYQNGVSEVRLGGHFSPLYFLLIKSRSVSNGN